MPIFEFCWEWKKKGRYERGILFAEESLKTPNSLNSLESLEHLELWSDSLLFSALQGGCSRISKFSRKWAFLKDPFSKKTFSYPDFDQTIECKRLEFT